MTSPPPHLVTFHPAMLGCAPVESQICNVSILHAQRLWQLPECEISLPSLQQHQGDTRDPVNIPWECKACPCQLSHPAIMHPRNCDSLAGICCALHRQRNRILSCPEYRCLCGCQQQSWVCHQRCTWAQGTTWEINKMQPEEWVWKT